MTRSFLSLLIFFFGTIHLWGQSEGNPDKCATDELHNIKMQDPEYAAEFQFKKEALEHYLHQQESEGARSHCDEVLLIPVAVHFQGVSLDMDCALEMALDQVERLNKDFSATNEDILTWEELQPEVWPGISNQESCIQFCLASLNHPEGFGLSDGDYAVTINETSGDNDPAWSGYMNFWVRDLDGGVLGYSPYPGNGNGDGITCSLGAFSSVSCGGNNVTPPYNLGRTMTHEVGHYLFLDHPWANGGCASNDDVADTPITDAPTFGCPEEETITCTQPILWPSYMEYCDDQCLFMFSAGQVERMEGHVNQNLQNLLNNSVTTCQEAACNNFEVSETVTHESCSGDDASIIIHAEGGAEPYLYSITGGSSALGEGEFQELSSGTYEVFVTDDAACEYQATVEITQEQATVVVVNSQNEYCSDASGTIEVDVLQEGTFEYRLQAGGGWQNSPLFEGLGEGDYTVEARNPFGCSGEVQVSIGNDSDLEVDVEKVQPVNCPWFDNGVISVKLQNGEEPYTYSLNNGEPQETGYFDELPVGDYEIFMTDQAGCETSRSFSIQRSFVELADDCPCEVFIPNAITPDGDNLNDFLEIVPSCPVSDYQLRIFDRWGKVVFQSEDPEEIWDGGTKSNYYANNDIYHYRMSYKWGESQTNSDIETQIESGILTVIR